MLSYIRSEKVRKKYAANLALFLAQRFDNSTEELMDLKELQQIIEKSLAALPNKCQIVFRMSRMEHRSIRHIAKDMNISTRTVENYLTQALKHLRTSLGEALALVIWLGG